MSGFRPAVMGYPQGLELPLAEQVARLVEDALPSNLMSSDRHTRAPLVVTAARFNAARNKAKLHQEAEMQLRHVEPNSNLDGINNPVAELIECKAHSQALCQLDSISGLRLTVPETWDGGHAKSRRPRDRLPQRVPSAYFFLVGEFEDRGVLRTT